MNATHGQGKAAFKGAEQASSGGGSSRGPETGKTAKEAVERNNFKVFLKDFFSSSS